MQRVSFPKMVIMTAWLLSVNPHGDHDSMVVKYKSAW